MRITRFNNSLEENSEELNSVIILSRSEAFQLIQNLLAQLEKQVPLKDFKSNEGMIYFAVRSDSEADSK